LPKLRLLFTKRGKACFIPHVALPQVFARAGKRAGLEFNYSEGYSPRPKISIGPALPVGVIGLEEPVDVDVLSWESPILERWNYFLPVGIRFMKGEEFEGKSLGKICKAASFSLFILKDFEPDGIKELLISKLPEGSILKVETDTVDKEIRIDLLDPQQNSPGLFVKALVSEGLIGGWKDIRMVRRVIGFWEDSRVKPVI